MNYIKVLIVATFMLGTFGVVVPPASVGALSDVKQRECRTKWHDQEVTQTDGNYNLPKAYKNGPCPEDKGGNCSVKSKGRTPTSGENIGGIIECPLPAAQDSPGGGGDPINPESETDPALDFDEVGCSDGGSCRFITKYVNPTVRFLSALVGVIVVISLIVGAIQFATSAGDPQKTAAGKDRIVKSLLALVIYIFTFALLQWLMPGGIV